MHIYLIYANADMTEGRGPMVLVKVISDEQAAIRFALAQPGVMGVRNRQHECRPEPVHTWTAGKHYLGDRIVTGDWEVIKARVDNDN